MPRRSHWRSWEPWEEDILRKYYPDHDLVVVTREVNERARVRGVSLRSQGAVKDHANDLDLKKSARWSAEASLKRGGRFTAIHCPTCGGTTSLRKLESRQPREDLLLEEVAAGGASGTGFVPTGEGSSIREALGTHPSVVKLLAARARRFLNQLPPGT